MNLSVIIPSYKDPLLQKTIDSVLDNSRTDIEIIAILDGPWLKVPIKKDPRVIVIELPENKGMRNAINIGLTKSTGRYIMKCDSHCLFAPDFDRVLSNSCRTNWLMIPRRYSLNEIKWKRDESRYIRDYHYISFPKETKFGFGMEPTDWIRYNRDHLMIDDTMTFQGSCWFAEKAYFMNRVGFLDDRKETYGPFAQEQLEIGMKYWLGGGEIKVNKNTWYAHLSKREHHYQSGEYDKTYKRDPSTIAAHTWTTQHWMNDREPNMIHPFSWLVEKFWPLPGWESNWKDIWKSLNL